MAAGAVLNLLFLFILVKWAISGVSHVRCCKISFVYINWQMSCCYLCISDI